MKNFNTILILIGILSGSILLVENIVLKQQAFVYVSNSSTWMLCVVSIITGMIIGFGIKGKTIEGKDNEGDNGFDF